MNESIHIAIRQCLPEYAFDEDEMRTMELPYLVDELLETCREYGIDEVLFNLHRLGMFFAPTGYTPLDQAAKDCDRLTAIKEKFDSAGVRMSLNPWHTLGHDDRGFLNMRDAFPFQPLVDHDGRESKASACLLCPDWREYIRELHTLYAAVHPHAIFIDDDFRLIHHVPLTFACFCPLHIREFNARYGYSYDRDSLVGDLFQTGEPHRVRKDWLDFSGDVHVETAAVIERAVHGTDPEVSLGLMTSNPDAHAPEGRKWQPLLRALCGEGRELWVRPNFPPYFEERLSELPRQLMVVRHTMARLPSDKTRHFPELDNLRPTGYNNSPNYLAFRTAVCCLLGIGQFHYSLFEFMGNPSTFEENREMCMTLRTNRAHWQEMLDLIPARERVEKGVQILTHEQSSAYVKKKSSEPHWRTLMPKTNAWADPLQLMGFPVTYASDAVVATSGDVINAFSDEEVQSLLSKGALLDLTAAVNLYARGFGRLIGIERIDPNDPHSEIVVGERITDDRCPYNGSSMRQKTLNAPAVQWRRFIPASGAQVLSTLFGVKREEIAPGVMFFENDQGGRIALFNTEAEIIESWGYRSLIRKTFMSDILTRLYKGNRFVEVEGAYNVLPLFSDGHDFSVIAVGNVRTSEAREMAVNYNNGTVKSVEAYRYQNGILAEMDVECTDLDGDKGTRFVIKDVVPPLGIALIKVRW